MQHEATLHVMVEDPFNEYDPVNLAFDIDEALPKEWKSAAFGAGYHISKIQSQGSEQYATLQRANEQQGHTIRQLQEQVAKKNQLEVKVVEMMAILGISEGYLDEDDLGVVKAAAKEARDQINDAIDTIEAAE